MAYISTEEVKVIREEIKQYFPKSFKFSIVRQHHSKLCVHLMQSPLKFAEKQNINDLYLEKAPHKTIFKIIKDIMNKGNFDESDSMTDYFHVGFYTEIELGKWDRPYKQIA